jgi:spore maturation protein CgeB
VQSEFLRAVAEFQPRVVVVSKGLHLGRATLERLSERGIYLVNWNPDDFFNMKNSSAELVNAMSAYDLIASSREHLFARYRQQGAKALLLLPWYYVTSLHFDHHLPVVREASFVGSWSPTREAFIGGLRKRFGVWGGGWEKSSMGFRRDHDVAGKVLSQLEMSQVFGTSRYNLNLLTHENNDRSNLRLFEVTASRGLLVTERNDEATSFLADGQDCLMFSSLDEVNEHFAEALDLERIARSGFDRITGGGNTFANRVDTLLAHVGARL